MIVGAPLSVEARPFAYVANHDSDDVSVIDLANDSVIATIPMGAGISALELAITPDGTRAYVTTPGAVKVIDTDPSSPTYNTVIASVPIDGLARAVAISPDGGLAYVTQYNGASVSAIETTTNTVIATIPVGGRPNGVVFSPDSTLAYVVNALESTLSVIDTASSTVINTITFPPNAPESIAITPDGAWLYITRSASQTVTVLDTASFTMFTNITAGFEVVRDAVSPDGNLAYVTFGFGSGPGGVNAIDTSSRTVVATVTLERGPYGVAVTPDSARAYVTRFDNAVDVIDSATFTVVDTVPVGIQPQGVAITPFVSDVGIGQSAAPDPVMSGADLTYTMMVTNNGPDPALSITMTDLLPAETTFVSCAATGTGVCSGSTTQIVTFARLESGETQTITIVATVNADVPDQTVISNTATVGSGTYDPVSSNNSATATVTVSNPPAGDHPDDNPM
jgi:uncharacterized repeat protein (TIGR01451 family)